VAVLHTEQRQARDTQLSIRCSSSSSSSSTSSQQQDSDEAECSTSGTADSSYSSSSCVITYRGVQLAVPQGSRLRSALLRGGLSPHNGKAQLINCRGLGTCGTCAVEVR
jgi:hypothetical protein